MKEGLQEKSVRQVYLSHDGRLWIVTENGLFQYDGLDIEHFGTKKGHTTTLPGNVTGGVAEDDRQRLWVTTDAGLVFIDLVSGNLVPRQEMGLPDSIFQEKMLTLHERKPGEIILLTGSHLYKYANGHLELWYSIPPALNPRPFIFLDEKEDGVYFFANGSDLYLLNKNGLQSLNYPIKNADGALMGPLSKSQCQLLNLPGVADGPVFCVLPDAVLTKQFQAAGPLYEMAENNTLQAVFPAWQAVLDYIGTEKSMIDITPSNLFISDVLQTKTGLLVLGTNYGVFLVHQRWRRFKHLPGTEGKPIRGMIQRSPDHLLIASPLETIDYDLQKRTARSFSNLRNIWNFMPVGKDSFLTCVETFEGVQLLRFTAPDKASTDIPSFSSQFGFTRSMAKTPQGFWGGNMGRHLFFLPEGGAPFEPSPYNDGQKTGKLVNVMHYSSRTGSLCAGAQDRLYVYTLDTASGRMTADGSAGLPTALQTTPVNALYESADGKMWIGCGQSGGLYAYDPAGRILQHWDISDGLSDNTIYSILGSNGDSILWMGTQSGLSRMNVSTQSFRNFYAEDGLEQNEFNTAARYRSPDGTFYFGGMNGVSYFRPEWMPAQTAPVTAYLKINVFDLKTQSRRQLYPNAGETVVFAPNEQYIQLDIRSNDLFNTAEIKARYKIEGISTEWRTAGTLEKITLAGLQPDNYTLTVQVQALNGNWSEPFVITLKILPFWYDTWWFRTLLVLGISATLYGAYRIRIRQIKKEYDLRKQLSDDLHDELGGRIFAMKALASQIAKPKLPENERRDIAEQFENLSKNVMTRVRDFIWTFDPKNDRLDGFLDRLEEFTFVTIRPIVQGVHFERDVPDGLIFASPSRHHILMVFQEILTNMVKHTRSQKISISVRIKAQSLRIHIVNRHSGLQISSQESTSHGLSSIKKRLQKNDIGLAWEETPDTQEAEITYKMTSHV